MNVLVTGGLGVNGSWVTRKLVERGIHPIVLENRVDFSLVDENVKNSITVVPGDITDSAFVLRTLREHRITRIVHMAALISKLNDDPLRAFTVNALATVQLLDAAVSAKVERFVFTSSRAVYGNVTGVHAHPTYKPVTEEHCLNASSIYDVCKVASEGMGRNYLASKGIEFIALRFAQIFGPGKLSRHGGFGILSSLIENAMAGEKTVVNIGGDQRDDIIYVDDVAEATVIATLHEQPKYSAYNISRGIASTLREFGSAVQAVIPEAEIEIGPGLDYMQVGVQYYAALDNSRAREDLGFEPRFTLEQGIADYVRQMHHLGVVPVSTGR